MSIGFTDRIPVCSGGKVVNLGPDSPPEEGAVRGEELGAAPNFGRRMERKMERARVFQRDMGKEGFYVGVRHQTCIILDVKLLVFRGLYHRVGFIFLR